MCAIIGPHDEFYLLDGQVGIAVSCFSYLSFKPLEFFFEPYRRDYLPKTSIPAGPSSTCLNDPASGGVLF